MPPLPRTLPPSKVDIGALTHQDEVDITFMAGSLGMRLDERGGYVPVSVVTNVVPGGQAEQAGVEVGCLVTPPCGIRRCRHAP